MASLWKGVLLSSVHRWAWAEQRHLSLRSSRGAGSSRQDSKYDYNKSNRKQVQPTVSNMGSELASSLKKQWASPVAQTVKNLSAMRETRVRPLGQKDPLERGIATHSSILAWRIFWTERSLAGYSPWGCKESHRAERLPLSLSFLFTTTDI